MTNEEIKTKALEIGDWYHEIKLCDDFVTPSKFGVDARYQWESTRKVRASLDYKGKTVLDMGTMDGMWAFEAESLGAAKVYAIDICQNAPRAKRRFLHAAQSLKSRVIYETVNAQELSQSCKKLNWPKFDIIQCLGLLYHVQNPMLVLNQVAACLTDEGKMLLETACIMDKAVFGWMRFNFDLGVYYDPTTFSVPNWVGLLGMLTASGFELELNTKSTVPSGACERLAIIAHRNGKPLPANLGLC